MLIHQPHVLLIEWILSVYKALHTYIYTFEGEYIIIKVNILGYLVNQKDFTFEYISHPSKHI